MSGAPYRFLDLSISEIREILEQEGFPRFRVSQIRRWLFSRKTDCFDAMTDISKADRSKLKSLFGNSVFSGRLLAESKSGDGTSKILIEWPDRHRVEAVLLRDERNHRTGGISTQVGCAMGCRFCASGLDGFVRNLTRGEIERSPAQHDFANRSAHTPGDMGIGEPTQTWMPFRPWSR